MPRHHQGADRFRYDGYTVDPDAGMVRCTYSTGPYAFAECITFESRGDWSSPAAREALRVLYLLAGVSYYKTTAAPLVDLGDLPTTAAERRFLAAFYVNGLSEFAHRNGIDLRTVRVIGPDRSPTTPGPESTPTPVPATATATARHRPLIPFGGGIDSIVTVDALAAEHAHAALCIVHPAGDRLAAIEDAAAVTGLPVIRVARDLDPQVRRSRELGFLNGHVPVTAIVTAAALMAAVLDGRDAVVLSNEWSASAPTVVADGHAVNHQWSKSEEFETAFAELVRTSVGPVPDVFSYLRPRTELWVAERFAELTRFHSVFRSCNRAFHLDPARRLDHWCGVCDKCCFIDLILAPFMEAGALNRIFGGHEPLHQAANEPRFAALLDLAGSKPFECVGETEECRAAVTLASGRADRRHTTLLQRLRRQVEEAGGAPADPLALLAPRGGHHIPQRYAPADLLVRAH